MVNLQIFDITLYFYIFVLYLYNIPKGKFKIMTKSELKQLIKECIQETMMNELSPELLRRAAKKAKEKDQLRAKKFSDAADKQAEPLSFYVDGDLKTYKIKQAVSLPKDFSVGIVFIGGDAILISPLFLSSGAYTVSSLQIKGKIKFDKRQQRAIADYLNNKKLGFGEVVDKWDLNKFPRL